eukprot:Awhi_evm1s2217
MSLSNPGEKVSLNAASELSVQRLNGRLIIKSVSHNVIETVDPVTKQLSIQRVKSKPEDFLIKQKSQIV